MWAGEVQWLIFERCWSVRGGRDLAQHCCQPQSSFRITLRRLQTGHNLCKTRSSPSPDWGGFQPVLTICLLPFPCPIYWVDNPPRVGTRFRQQWWACSFAVPQGAHRIESRTSASFLLALNEDSLSGAGKRKQLTGRLQTSARKFHLQGVVVGLHCALVGATFLSAAPVSTRTKNPMPGLGAKLSRGLPPLPPLLSEYPKGCILREQKLRCLLLWHNLRKGPLCSLSEKPKSHLWEKPCSVCLYFPLHPSTGSLGWQHQRVLWLLLQK